VRERKRERERRLEKHFRNLNVFLDFFTFGLRAIEKNNCFTSRACTTLFEKNKIMTQNEILYV